MSQTGGSSGLLCCVSSAAGSNQRHWFGPLFHTWSLMLMSLAGTSWFWEFCPSASHHWGWSVLQTLHTGHLFRFSCAWKSYFTLEDDTYSFGYTPLAVTHPVFANNYCYLHIPWEYVADEKHKQSSKNKAVAQIKAVAQRAFTSPEVWSILLLLYQRIPREPLRGHIKDNDENNLPVLRDWDFELKIT